MVMAEAQKKKLLFIRSPSHSLKAIESFLTKRSFYVIFESNLEATFSKIEDLKPDFIFVAWDHPDPQLANVAKALGEMTTALIIPYVQANSKEAIRRLEFSGYSQKLYPPLSGPAIERLVLKAAKDLEVDPHAFTNNGRKSEANPNEIQMIKSSVPSGSSSFARTQTSGPQSDLIIQHGHRSDLLKLRNESLSQLEEKTLGRAVKENLKSDFEEQFKQSFEDMLATYNEASADNNLSPTIENTKQIDTSIRTEDGTLTAEMAQLQINAKKNSDIALINQHKSIYCMIVQSETWCGYLVVYSDFEIDLSLSQNLFQQWLSGHFKNLLEFAEAEQFAINISVVDYKMLAEASADYSEIVVMNDKEIIVSFFTVDPQQLLVDLNDKDLIAVPLEIIPSGRTLLMSFYLHLPQNEKYLLYTPVNQKIEKEQHRRLTEKSVQTLYTPIEFEREYRILKAENFLTSFQTKQKTGS